MTLEDWVNALFIWSAAYTQAPGFQVPFNKKSRDKNLEKRVNICVKK